MRVFVLCTGRCGSVGFIRACQHITNFTAGHETNWPRVGPGRLEYPDQHIEADNRLSWFLGRLDQRYGDQPYYVHLTRDPLATAKSYYRRWGPPGSITRAYGQGILYLHSNSIDVCLDYVETVNANIRHFLKDKSKTQHIAIESIREEFPRFWERIGAEGDLQAAMAEWDVQHNSSATYQRAARLGTLVTHVRWACRRALNYVDVRRGQKREDTKVLRK